MVSPSPPSVLEGGGAELVKRLKTPERGHYIREQINHPTERLENAILSNGFQNIVIGCLIEVIMIAIGIK